MEWRHSQVVRRGSAKSLSAGSNPAAALILPSTSGQFRFWAAVIVLIVASCLLFWFQKQYQPQDTEPLALRLKKMIENQEKLPATGLPTSTNNEAQNDSEQSITAQPLAVAELSSDDLGVELQKFNDLNALDSLEKIERGLALADELIDREPSHYSALKSKLILLLSKESSFNQSIDEQEFENTLEEMARLDVFSTEAQQQEAFLIAQRNAQLDELDDQAAALEEQLFEIEDEIDLLQEELDFAEDEAVALRLEQEILQLEASADNLDAELADIETQEQELEEAIEEGIFYDLEVLRDDLVDVPFYRRLSKGQYQQVADEAEALLAEFPDSISGHFFLIKALQAMGENEEALFRIENSGLTQPQLKELQKRLEGSEGLLTNEYWKSLRF